MVYVAALVTKLRAVWNDAPHAFTEYVAKLIMVFSSGTIVILKIIPFSPTISPA
jgi:hypothetical protein